MGKERSVTPKSISRISEKPFQKDNGHDKDVSTEKRMKDDAHISPFQAVDKSSLSADVRRSLQLRVLDKELLSQRKLMIIMAGTKVEIAIRP